jgi:hypothetical protein
LPHVSWVYLRSSAGSLENLSTDLLEIEKFDVRARMITNAETANKQNGLVKYAR